MIHPTAVIGDPPEHRDFPRDTFWHGHKPEIDVTARIEALVTVDAGMFRPTRIGARTWLMKKVHIGHDATVGHDCEIAPLSSVGGEVEIGNGVKVGQGVTFKPRVKVGDGAVIGMGAVVTKDVPAGETWVGNPAHRLEPKRRCRACGKELGRSEYLPYCTPLCNEASEKLEESVVEGWQQLAEHARR